VRARCLTEFRNAEWREAAAAVDVSEGGRAEVEPLHTCGRLAAGERRVLVPRDAPSERRWRVLRLPRHAADERRVFPAT
jgi:hypothetical protein